METNFFTAVQSLPKAGDWRISISFIEDGKMLVSVLFEQDKDGKGLAPLLFNGTASELDKGFFTAIAEPVQRTSELFANISAHLLSVEKAKKDLVEKAEKKSASATSSKSAPKSEDKADRKKRYDDLIAKAKDLNGQCKYDEALAVLPANEEFPEKSEELDGLRAKLEERKKQKNQMSLL